MSDDARSLILRRIEAALPDGGALPPDQILQQWRVLPRRYIQQARLDRQACLDLLEERLRDYDAEVTRGTPSLQVADAVADIFSKRGIRRALRARGFPAAWLPAGVDCQEDLGLSARELDQFEAIVTTATAAIAETGSLVLQSGPGEGRRAATLVPDFHLCVLRAQDVVETVPEAFARIAPTAHLPTTFVSGPSATADIEMTRIKGVHGPRFLHVLLLT